MREDNVRKIWSDAELDAALSDLHDDVEEADLSFTRASLMAAAGVTEPPAAPRRRGTWRWIAVAAAVVLLAGGLAVVTGFLSPDAPETSRPAALQDIDRPLAPGEFRYAQKLSWLPEFLDGQPVKVQQRIELWIPADPTGVWHRRTSWTGAVHTVAPSPAKDVEVDLTPHDEYGPAGRFPDSPRLGGQTNQHWKTPFQDWLTPDAAFVASIRPDPATLVERLQFDTIDVTDDGRANEPTDSLTMVRSVLETGLPGKDVRVALRDALGRLTGLFATPGQTPDGRPATVVIAKDSAQRLYFDPATAQLLAWTTDPAVPTRISRTGEIPLSTSRHALPPSTGAPPPVSPESPVSPVSPTTTNRPDAPDLGYAPGAAYSFAITRTPG